MDLTIGHYIHNDCDYSGMLMGQKPNRFVESNEIDVDLFEDECVQDQKNDEAKVLETNGLIRAEENKHGCETVEICQKTVNPNQKVGEEDFKILKTIGKGGYGTVFLVQKVKQPLINELFAMKVLKKAKIVCNEKDTSHTISERNILEMLRHPFLVKLYYAFQSHSCLYIVLEYCPGGELFNYLERIVFLKEDAACFYVSEIALAIGHLHNLGIIYRDLKSENILLDKDGHVKLTDFGLSKEGTKTTNTFCGTIDYMAPEIIRCAGHGKEVDWWSLGTLLYDMLSGGPPFYQDKNKTDTAQSILHSTLKYPDSFSPEAVSLIKSLLTRDPKKRLGSERDVEEIKEHQFFVVNVSVWCVGCNCVGCVDFYRNLYILIFVEQNVNWKDVFDRKTKPPFKPILTSATDVSMFDQNFTNLRPSISPADVRTAVPNNLFQGFSYVASSFCDSNLRREDESAASLRSERRKLLFNKSIVQGYTSSPRLSRIMQEPSSSNDIDPSDGL
ncbi:Ribosomal protein S6 kinase beta-1 [Cichlidogyrus casuarinus]|uniref:Ribosomal protein S6 kinase beta-1 n=1 Tax=Cichlidogyrus casuarinus TaxID=1844966 RepID=A0ABD2QM33_9PLAT